MLKAKRKKSENGDIMAIIRMKELRQLGNDDIREKLRQLRTELSSEKGAIAASTKPENPGKIKEIKRTIARINTVLHERGED